MLKTYVLMVGYSVERRNRALGRKKKRQQGFTLIEMTLVLFLLTVTSLYIFHNFGANHEKILERAAVTLQYDIRFTQQTAISENKRCYLQFWDDASGYSIYKTEYDGTATLVKEAAFLDAVTLDYFNSNQHSNHTIIFTSTGTTASPATIRLYSGGKKIGLTVNLGAGRVSVQEISDLQSYGQ